MVYPKHNNAVSAAANVPILLHTFCYLTKRGHQKFKAVVVAPEGTVVLCHPILDILGHCARYCKAQLLRIRT